MSTPANIRAERRAKRALPDHGPAEMILDAWDSLFGTDGAEAVREQEREQKWQRAEVERRAKDRL